MADFLRDLWHAARAMRRTPGITCVALSAFAIGIGVNSAVFSVVHAALLRPLPYDDASRLMMLWERNPRLQQGQENLPIAAPNYLDWQKQSESFDQIALFRRSSFNIVDGGPPERVEGAVVAPSLFAVLGVRPLLGRPLVAGDDDAGENDVVVISYGFWQSHFGGADDVIGRRVSVDGAQVSVVGVMPPAFQFPREIESASPQPPSVWIPLTLSKVDRVNRLRHLYRAIGRLKPDRTIAQAATELSGISQRLAQAYPDSNSGFDVAIVPLHRQVEGDVRTPLLVLLSAAGFVLLIACTNVANLVLGRMLERRRDIAVRQVLGVSRWRLIKHLLAESLLFGAIGGALGLLIAFAVVNLLVTMPLNIPRFDDVDMDVPVLAFSLAASVLSALFCAVAPGLIGSRVNLANVLRDGSRGATGGRFRVGARQVLVVAEIAIALVLAAGASLLIRSFVRLLDVDPGFIPEQVLTVQIDLPANRYPDESAQARFARNVLEQMRTVAGVTSAGLVSHVPLGAVPTQANFSIEGVPADPNARVFVDRISASGGFFDAAGIRLLHGRAFTDRDTQDAPRVVMVNQTLARRFFSDQDPVGRRLTFGDADETSVWWSVIGVVADIRYEALDTQPKLQVFVPASQVPRNRLHLMVRTTSDPGAFVSSIRQSIWAVDSELGLAQVRTMRDIVADSIARRRFTMLLLSAFAVIGLVLAVSGTFAVVSWAVAQRSSEFGVRMALGAVPATIVGIVVAEILGLIAAALTIGIPGTLILSHLLSDMLYETTPMDPWSVAITALLLIVVTLIAGIVPARRAACVDPVVTLRR